MKKHDIILARNPDGLFLVTEIVRKTYPQIVDLKYISSKTNSYLLNFTVYGNFKYKTLTTKQALSIEPNMDLSYLQNNILIKEEQEETP